MTESKSKHWATEFADATLLLLKRLGAFSALIVSAVALYYVIPRVGLEGAERYFAGLSVIVLAVLALILFIAVIVELFVNIDAMSFSKPLRVFLAIAWSIAAINIGWLGASFGALTAIDSFPDTLRTVYSIEDRQNPDQEP